MTRVTLVEVTKRFGKTIAVDRVSVEIKEGELFTLLGPSGCGKTTTLRLIAGFEIPDSGRIYFDDQDVTYLKPYHRNTAMVFQNYALWPHMTVYDNIAYGLKLRKIPKSEIRKRVKEVLELVKLEGLENRYPSQLSGGQQQRVALARALVIEPKVLLLDEPLSNLDAKLRVGMREEIKKLQRELGITTIYVTHDQEEAMCLSDRMAVMNNGRVLQIGTPKDIYFHPKNLFIAWFIGKTNIFEAQVETYKDYIATARRGDLVISGVVDSDVRLNKGDKVAVVIRPESFMVKEPKPPYNTLEGIVELSMFLGDHVDVRMDVNGLKLLAYLYPGEEGVEEPKLMSKLRLYLPYDRVRILPWEELEE